MAAERKLDLGWREFLVEWRQATWEESIIIESYLNTESLKNTYQWIGENNVLGENMIKLAWLLRYINDYKSLIEDNSKIRSWIIEEIHDLWLSEEYEEYLFEITGIDIDFPF